MENMIMCVAGTVLAVGWFLLYVGSTKKYRESIEALDGNDYFMKDMYGVGYRLIEMVHVNFNIPFFQKKMKKLSELYGKKAVRLLVISDLAAEITYITALLPLGLLLAVIMNEAGIALVVLLLALFLAFYIEYDKNDKVEKRREEILKDFPHALSQMALLTNAGMPLRETIETTAKSEGGILYKELRVLTDDIKNGIPDYEALHSFADRCGVDEVRKLSGLIIQNVKKGSTGLADALMELSNEVWRNRTAQVRELGEKASSRLLVPILIIFGGIMVMVVVPIFRNMSF